jgi:multiple sugar transport system permease protein
MTAFKSPSQFAQEHSLALPRPFGLENFGTLLTGPAQFGSAILVTVAVTSVIVIFQLGFSVLAAYAFARIDFAGRRVLFWVYLAGLMVPNIVLVIPLYLMMVELGLRNTFWGLVLPFMFGSPYAIFLLREYFRGIPRDLVDAARIDGAGHWRILSSIIVPLSKPIIATLTLITIVGQWNSFLWPLVITSGSEWSVITVATASLQSQYNGNWTLVMAATTLALVPLVVLFLAFQKQVVRSITISGFK